MGFRTVSLFREVICQIANDADPEQIDEQFESTYEPLKSDHQLFLGSENLRFSLTGSSTCASSSPGSPMPTTSSAGSCVLGLFKRYLWVYGLAAADSRRVCLRTKPDILPHTPGAVPYPCNNGNANLKMFTQTTRLSHSIHCDIGSIESNPTKLRNTQDKE